MNPREGLEFAKKNKVQVVDLKFVDLLGTWQHFSIPVAELTEGLFKDGSGLDGSSIRGWKRINDSDLLMVPDSTTACLDPFCSVPTLSLVGNVLDPITREPYDRDPRFIAKKELGTSGRKDITCAERSVTRKDTFRFHRPTHNRISVARWFWRCKRPGFILRSTTTRPRRQARQKSICASTRWARQRTN